MDWSQLIISIASGLIAAVVTGFIDHRNTKKQIEGLNDEIKASLKNNNRIMNIQEMIRLFSNSYSEVMNLQSIEGARDSNDVIFILKDFRTNLEVIKLNIYEDDTKLINIIDKNIKRSDIAINMTLDEISESRSNLISTQTVIDNLFEEDINKLYEQFSDYANRIREKAENNN